MLPPSCERVIDVLGGRGKVTVILHLLSAGTQRFSKLSAPSVEFPNVDLCSAFVSWRLTASYAGSFIVRYRLELITV
jgi:hypothetical protein